MIKKIGLFGFILTFCLGFLPVNVVAVVQPEEAVIKKEQVAQDLPEDKAGEEAQSAPVNEVVGENEIDYKDLCENAGGDYNEEYKECEGIDQKSCEDLGGQFDGCASACRNDPDAEVCIEVCVEVCYFGDQDIENPDGTIGVEIENFEECEKAGGKIVESLPRECFINGESFMESEEEESEEEDDNMEVVWILVGIGVVGVLGVTTFIISKKAE